MLQLILTTPVYATAAFGESLAFLLPVSADTFLRTYPARV